MDKFEIWNNDACDIYDSLRDEELVDIDEEDIDEEYLWDLAYEIVSNYKDEQIKNILDIDMMHNLIAVGNLERWNGSRSAYKDLETENIADAIDVVLGAYDGDNSFSVYVEDGKLLVSQLGHDNPTNPSIMEIRMLKDFDTFDDMLEEHDDSPESLRNNSVSIGESVRELY